jgi:hypothetical protein
MLRIVTTLLDQLQGDESESLNPFKLVGAGD